MVDFHISEYKTTCTLDDDFIGEADCSKHDVFNSQKGRLIALGRAAKVAGLPKYERIELQKALQEFEDEVRTVKPARKPICYGGYLNHYNCRCGIDEARTGTTDKTVVVKLNMNDGIFRSRIEKPRSSIGTIQEYMRYFNDLP